MKIGKVKQVKHDQCNQKQDNGKQSLPQDVLTEQSGDCGEMRLII
jgi:hypothetical protein